jgi:hypothetical protein
VQLTPCFIDEEELLKFIGKHVLHNLAMV